MQSAFLLPPSRTHPDVHTPHMAPRTACPSTYCPALTLMYTTHGSSYSVPIDVCRMLGSTWGQDTRGGGSGGGVKWIERVQDVGQYLGTRPKGQGSGLRVQEIAPAKVSRMGREYHTLGPDAATTLLSAAAVVAPPLALLPPTPVALYPTAVSDCRNAGVMESVTVE